METEYETRNDRSVDVDQTIAMVENWRLPPGYMKVPSMVVRQVQDMVEPLVDYIYTLEERLGYGRDDRPTTR